MSQIMWWKLKELAALPATGELYVIGADRDDAPIKLGWALSPEDRLDELQTGNFEVLHLYDTMPGTVRLERAIHNYLKQYRVRGEWFTRKPRVTNIFYALRPLAGQVLPGSRGLALQSQAVGAYKNPEAQEPQGPTDVSNLAVSTGGDR